MQEQAQARKQKSASEVAQMQKELADLKANPGAGGNGSITDSIKQNVSRANELSSILKARGAPLSPTDGTAIEQASTAGRGARIAAGAAPDGTPVN